MEKGAKCQRVVESGGSAWKSSLFDMFDHIDSLHEKLLLCLYVYKLHVYGEGVDKIGQREKGG